MMPGTALAANPVRADPPAGRAGRYDSDLNADGSLSIGGTVYTHDGCAAPGSSTCAACQIQALGASDATAFGIDVSLWQGDIDWETVAEQVDFVIIRCGFGEDLPEQDDDKWYNNVEACTRLGIPFGVYLYSYATTDAKALSEAKHVLRLLEGYEPTLPVYLDLEDDLILRNCDNEDILRHVQIFCDAIEEAGYQAGIYSSLWWWNTFLTDDAYDQWDRWLAQYASAPGLTKDFSVWQYTNTGRIDGIYGDVDLNYWFGEFPPHTHSYTGAVTMEPGCDVEGVLTYTCECGDSYTEPIPAAGHDYTPLVSAPTCTGAGFTTWQCGVCGNTYQDTFLDPIGHTYADGYCTLCGEVDPDHVFIPAAVATGTASGCPGETVTVDVTMADNPGFADFRFTIGYDPAAMTLTGVTGGDVLAAESGTLTLSGDTAAWDGSENTTGNGTLLNLTFAISEEAQPGTYAVTAALAEEDSMSFADALGRPGHITFTPGSVEVLVPDTALARGTSGDLAWVLDQDGTLTFSGTGSMDSYDSRTAMPWYDYRELVTAVVLEEGAAAIGDYAFCGMHALASVSIPGTVTAIGGYAFKDCPALTGAVLPEGLTRLGESAFYGCASLTAMDIPASLYTIQPYTFKNCTSLADVTFHEGNLQKISDGAFYGTGLTEVTFPDCLDILDVYSFKNCSDLEIIRLGSGLTEIREAVFYGTAVTEMEIPAGVTAIRPYAFKNCADLTGLTLPDTLTTVGEAAFYGCTALEALDLPDAVTAVGNYAFRKCAALTEISFGAGLETIGESAFYGCAGLTELVLPEGLTAIGSYAFKGCTGLTAATLPGTLAVLGDSAFHSCTGLEGITIPAGVTAIGEYCFSGSWNLWQITFEGDAPAIGTGAFRGLAAVARYPGNNATWTADVMQHYGGAITWKAV